MSEEKQQYQAKDEVATGFDWELVQAINHLQAAISVTDNQRAHLLLSAVQVIKGVRES